MGLPSGVYNQSYEQETAIVRTRTQWVLLIMFLVFAFSFPFWVRDGHILTLVIMFGIAMIASLGLNLLVGYCGQISLSHSAFIAVGAYASAILNKELGVPFWASLPAAAIIAGTVGLVFGAPALVLKGFYLVMSTLAAQFIIMYIITHISITGAVNGYIAQGVFDDKAAYACLVLAILAVATFFAKNLARCNTGRNFVAVRDNDIAAGVCGVNVFKAKMLAFFIACAYAGAAGSLWAHFVLAVQPDTWTLMTSLWYLGYLIVGGLGTTLGPFLGVILVMLLNEGLSVGVTSLAVAVPLISGYLFPLRDMMFGAIIIIFLIFEPRGLAHRWAIVQSFYRLWPFSYR